MCGCEIGNNAKIIKKIYRRLNGRLHACARMYTFSPLKRKIIGCRSVLDLGCGYNSPLKHFSKNFYSVGVELFKPYLLRSKEARVHHDYILADITKLEFSPKSFDTVLALDVLEHLTKGDGLNLIKNMEKIACKNVVIVTPNGFLHQPEYDENVFQAHQSGWYIKEFRSMGYEVKGINGLRFLRKESAEIRFRPKKLFLIISYISQKLTYNFPNLAFQLLCMKAKNT